ncbi:MAG: NAD(P)-binding domain-containing protein, partial [Burkholderiales bacterium]|nr:NAD(P)-binding domain-containing protein [Burkholderiales bacterium]
MPDQPIAIIGAGSWGTALALQFARSGRRVRLWDIDTKQLAVIAAERINTRYLPDAPFPDNIEVRDDLESCLDNVTDIVVAVPSHGLRDTLQKLQPILADSARVCWAT